MAFLDQHKSQTINILLNISSATEESRRNDPDVNSPAPGTGQHFRNTEAVY